MIGFSVRGIPITQGNKTAFVAGDRAVMREGRTKKANEKFKMWRHAINDEARKAMGDLPMIAGPVALTAHFTLPRPASAPKRRRTWPIGARSGDVDKLARALLDGMTGVCFGDDAQVVRLNVRKDYGAQPGVEVLFDGIGDEGTPDIDQEAS